MADDEKSCPMCAETVKAAAARCRFCGYDFYGTGPTKTEARVEAAAEKTSNAMMKFAIGLIALVLLVAFCGKSKDEVEAVDAPPVPVETQRASALKVDILELSRAYDANEAAAQSRYGSRWLEVSGVVDGVDLDFMDEPVLKLATDTQFMPAMAHLTDADKSQAAEMKKGQKISLLCQGVTEVMSIPSLKECSLVD